MKPEEFIESRRRRERCYSWLLRRASSVLALPRSRHALLTTSANLAGETSLTRGPGHEHSGVGVGATVLD